MRTWMTNCLKSSCIRALPSLVHFLAAAKPLEDNRCKPLSKEESKSFLSTSTKVLTATLTACLHKREPIRSEIATTDATLTSKPVEDLDRTDHLHNPLREYVELPKQMIDIRRVLSGHLVDIPAHPGHHPEDPFCVHTPCYGGQENWLS